MPEGRLGVVAIFVKNRLTAARRVNEILTAYGEIIVGRMGIPHRARGLSVMALIVDGAADAIGAMAGKLGSLPGVQVKTILAPVSVSTSGTSVTAFGKKVDCPSEIDKVETTGEVDKVETTGKIDKVETTGEVDKVETTGEVGPGSGRGAEDGEDAGRNPQVGEDLQRNPREDGNLQRNRQEARHLQRNRRGAGNL